MAPHCCFIYINKAYRNVVDEVAVAVLVELAFAVGAPALPALTFLPGMNCHEAFLQWVPLVCEDAPQISA